MSIDDELLRQQAEEEQDQNKENEPAGGNNNSKDKERKNPLYVQKYTETDLLAESVIVGGMPQFAVARTKSHYITLEGSIPKDDISEYKPYAQSAYLNKPYIFKSKEDFESCAEKARKESLDTLYSKVKSIWLKYIDADDFHVSICAADTIFTYYQDKIGLTHYLFFVGNNSSGKSNNLTVLHFLAYRNFTSTDITAANIYQFLGSGEEGLGTLCEDEADRIDEDRQKMAIYKNGNITGRPVARTDTSFGRKQLKLNTFCFKAFAAERFPDSIKAKGFNQRVIELQCSFGDPEQDIAEVANPAGAEEFQHLLNELNEMRNLLIAYRLLHFNEKIPDIKLNIKGREKQLFKPVLRVFQNTRTLGELLPVVSKYVAQKREANFSTLHAFLYKSVRDIIKDQGKTELTSRFIWDYIKANLQGEDIHGKPLSYETPEFGVITQKEITQTLEHIFGAKPKKVNGIRTLVFDLPKLQRLGRVYDLETEIKVIREGENLGSDRSDWTDVGLGRHMITSRNEHKEIQETAISEREDASNQQVVDPIHPPQVTHPTLTSFRCYHKDCEFQTNDEREYKSHATAKHLKNPLLFPSKFEIEKYGLQAQGKNWEI